MSHHIKLVRTRLLRLRRIRAPAPSASAVGYSAEALAGYGDGAQSETKGAEAFFKLPGGSHAA